MKVVVTGSHFSPAYAVIKRSNWKVTYIGRKFALSNSEKISYEYKLCSQKNIPFRILGVPRFSRNSPIRSFFSSLALFGSVTRAQKLLKEINPDVVVSFGGYISLPVVTASYFLKKPIIVHEQTLGAGFSNKLASIFASKVFLSFSSSRKYFPKKKIVLTGNPIREDILVFYPSFNLVKTDKPIIYVTGGSTGSAAVNDILGRSIEDLSDYFIVHQKGASDNVALDKNVDYLSRDYFTPKEVGWLLRKASLVISRSGINTVSEILYFGIPAIFIPLPYGQKNEQLKNARYAEKHGLAVYFRQEKITPEILVKTVHVMIKRGKKERKVEADSLRHEKAADTIIYETEKLFKKSREK